MKTETDTPRTDEAYNEWLESQKASDILNRMMQLERELNACEADYAVTKDERDQYRRELNAAKALAEQNGKLAHDYSIAAVKFKGQLNEAITELSHIANLLDDHFEEGGTIAGMGTTNKARQIIEKSKQ